MADDTPTSPPGSWPDSNIPGESSADESELGQAPASQMRQMGIEGMSQSKESPPEKAAMLPPEILEQ